ncbi:hypothetical protein WOLCODRAFT_64481 [Wolfiporia cocos MD-104 SS10]|uniref:C2 domain-containing protein n=1 Tax=Wolfiporia cocos (strain MD-104) TaxID=742152 RepID=A0A2H3J8B7_WOLCO|nr:hypothetical protein WOLCODRAFT_64481 [Wolfiporia cocos MD-104 SS10]
MAFYDITIQFISASGLPKMDIVGSADPYFVAKLDDRVKFVSSVNTGTRSPVWDESWRVKNVPENAALVVEVLDKDSKNLTDGYVGHFCTDISSGEKELHIRDKALKRHRGTFYLAIDVVPSTDPDALHHPYTFDGPVRYSRHFSPTVGRITSADSRLYSTWKVNVKGVRRFFGDEVQTWNTEYSKARSIFHGPTSGAVRAVIHTGHKMLYTRAPTNRFGVIATHADAAHLLHDHAGVAQHTPFEHRIKPALYTYVLAADDDTLRFSETGAAFLMSMASKHALHSNCAQAVRYSGEFHPRPRGGWDSFDDATPDEDVEWELVVDNKSGTYTPNSALLPAIKDVFEYNFPGFSVVPLDYRDPELKKSSQACLAYALAKRAISKGELQPHAHGGRETLAERAAEEIHKLHHMHSHNHVGNWMDNEA